MRNAVQAGPDRLPSDSPAESRRVKQTLEDALDRLALVCGVPPEPNSLLSPDLPWDLVQPVRALMVERGPASVAAWGSAMLEALPSALRSAIAETDLALVPAAEGARIVVLTDAGGRAVSACVGPIHGVTGVSFDASVSTEVRLAAVARLRPALREVIWAGGEFDASDADALERCEALDTLRAQWGPASTDVRWSIAHRLRVLWCAGTIGPEAFSSPNLQELSLLGHRLDAAHVKSLVAAGKLRSLWMNGGHSLTDAQLKTLARLPLEEVVISSERLKAKAGAALALAPTLRRVSLRDCAIDDTTVVELARLPNLTRLNLTGTGISDQCAHALGRMRALRELIVDRTGVGPDAMAAAGSLPALVRLSAASCTAVSASLEGLAWSPSLAWVNFDGCGLDGAAVAALSRITTLERVSLANARVNPAAALNLTKLGRLRRLDIHRTLLGDVPLFDGLPSLQALSAWGCGLTMKAASGLERVERLTELDLSDNDLGPEAGALAARIASLRHLRLDRVGLTDAGLSHLAQRAPSLLQLALASNQLGSATGQLCARMPTLQFLQLAANPLGDDGAEGIERLTDLRTVMLDDTGISGVTARRLSALIRLRTLSTSGNRIDAPGARLLAALPRLEWLDLVNNPVGPETLHAPASLKVNVGQR